MVVYRLSCLEAPVVHFPHSRGQNGATVARWSRLSSLKPLRPMRNPRSLVRPPTTGHSSRGFPETGAGGVGWSRVLGRARACCT
eukprot:15457256-Alexandrium_andersonii.AAC.1